MRGGGSQFSGLESVRPGPNAFTSEIREALTLSSTPLVENRKLYTYPWQKHEPWTPPSYTLPQIPRLDAPKEHHSLLNLLIPLLLKRLKNMHVRDQQAQNRATAPTPDMVRTEPPPPPLIFGVPWCTASMARWGGGGGHDLDDTLLNPITGAHPAGGNRPTGPIPRRDHM